MPLQVDELITLQRLDDEIQSLRQEIAMLDEGKRTKKLLGAREKVADLLSQKVHALEARQQDAELGLAGVEEKKKAVNKRLYSGTITNPKELQALQQEYAMLERQQSRFDETVLTLMEALELAHPATEQARQSAVETKQLLDEQLQRTADELRRLRSAVKKAERQRGATAAALEPETLERYEFIRTRQRNEAVGMLEEGNCGSCRTKLPTTVVQRIRRGEEYVFCENCQRFVLPGAAKAVAS